MKVFFDPDFYKKYKKVDIRIQNKTDDQIRIFRQNPLDLQLNNHKLRNKYEGYSSIDITSDYRAIYKEVQIGNDIVAYFFILGTHKELYGTTA